MDFCDRDTVRQAFAGKRVAVVGSGPGCLDNVPGFVDSHDVVVRVNNYRLSPAAGFRTDCFYSFFGGSITKTAAELKADGVSLCLCKCPDAKFMRSAWHERNNKPNGVDFRYIYRARAAWWFCPTWVPEVDEFKAVFDMLGGHIPSTGFSALQLVLSCAPASCFVTGFDFFSSRIHNVSELWRPGNPDDPIGHAPERERAWLAERVAAEDGPTLVLDKALSKIMKAK